MYVDIKPFTEDSNHIDINTLHKDSKTWSSLFYVNPKWTARNKLKTTYFFSVIWNNRDCLNLFYQYGSRIHALILNPFDDDCHRKLAFIIALALRSWIKLEKQRTKKKKCTFPTTLSLPAPLFFDRSH